MSVMKVVMISFEAYKFWRPDTSENLNWLNGGEWKHMLNGFVAASATALPLRAESIRIQLKRLFHFHPSSCIFASFSVNVMLRTALFAIGSMSAIEINDGVQLYGFPIFPPWIQNVLVHCGKLCLVPLSRAFACTPRAWLWLYQVSSSPLRTNC